MDTNQLIRKLAARESWASSGAESYHKVASLPALRGLGELLDWSICGRCGPWFTPANDPDAMHWILCQQTDFWLRVSDAGRALLATAPPPRADQQTEPERAIALYDWAVAASDDDVLTDVAAHNFIRERQPKEPLPKFDTWVRNLRRARKARGEQKAPNKRAHFPARPVRRNDL
jgi:hypothetical protein